MAGRVGDGDAGRVSTPVVPDSTPTTAERTSSGAGATGRPEIQPESESFVRGGRPLAGASDETTTTTAGLTQPGQRPLAPTQRTQVAAKLKRALKDAVTAAAPRLGRRQTERLEDKHDSFKTALLHGQIRTGADAHRLGATVTALAREVATLGVMDESTRAALTSARAAALDKIAGDLGLVFTPRQSGGRLVGLVASTRDGQPLSAAQRDGFDAAQVLVMESERLFATPAALDRGDIAWLDLRDALLRRNLELMMPPAAGTEYPDGTETEIDLTSDALATVDAMLASDEPMTPNLLAQVESLTTALEGASTGALGAGLSGELEAPSVPGQTGGRFDTSSFARRARLNQPTGPQAPAGPTAPRVTVPGVSIGAPTAPGAGITSPTIPGGGITTGRVGITAPGQPTGPTAPGAPLGPSAALEGPQRALLEMMARAPHGTSDAAGAFVDGYAAGMDALTGVLPPALPFTYRLPRPMTVGSPSGDHVVIPAGAEISRDADGAYRIDTPGMVMQNGASHIAAGRSTLTLGSDVDGITFTALQITGEESSVDLTGGTAEIDRDARTSLIRADSAAIDWSTGQVDLTNAEMMFGPGHSHIQAESMLWEEGNDHVSLTSLSFAQTDADGISTVAFTGDDAQVFVGETALTADHLSMQMVRSDDPNAAETLEMQAHGLSLANGVTQFAASEAVVQVVQNADGSSSLSAVTQDLAVTSESSQLSTVGETRVDVAYDAAGRVDGMTMSAAQLDFTDASGNRLDATNGAMAMDFDDQGRLTGLSGGADQLTYAGPAGTIDASGGSLELIYEEGQLRSLGAEAQQLHFTDDGRELDVTGGNLNLVYGDSGYLSHFDAEADRVTYDGGEAAGALIRDGRLSADFDEQGGLTGFAGRATELEVRNGDTNLHATDADLQVAYGDNGLLQSVQASSGDTQIAGAFGSLETHGETRLDVAFGDNGNLSRITSSTGRFDFTGVDGDRIGVDHGAADVSFYEDGSLQQATASAGQLAWLSADGDELQANGVQVDLQFGEGGVLRRGHAESGDLTYAGGLGNLSTTGTSTLDVAYDAYGNLQSLDFASDDVLFTNAEADVHAVGGELALQFQPDGRLSQVHGKTDQLEMSGAFGELNAQGETRADLGFDGQGNLASVSAHATQLTHSKDGSALSITDGDLNATFVNGQLESITASAAQASHSQGPNSLNVTHGQLDARYEDGQLAAVSSSIGQGTFTGSFGSLQLEEGGAFDAEFEAGVLSRVHGDVHSLTYAGDQGLLTLEDGTVDGTFAADGTIEHLKVDTQGLDMQTGEAHFTAESAVVELTQQSNGMSTLTATGQDLAMTSETGNLTGLGETTLDVTYDADGDLRALSAHADDLTFADGSNRLQTVGGNVDLGFDEDGRITGLTGNADAVTFTGDAGDLAATNGQIDLAYQEGVLRSATGSAASLSFAGDGREVSASGGNLALVFGETGQLQAVDAFAGAVDYSGDGTTAHVTNGQLNAAFTAEGGLSGFSARADDLRIDSNGTAVSAVGSELSVTYGEDGLLDAVNLAVGQVDVSGGFGHLVANGESTLDATWHDNGSLANVAASSQDVTFTSDDANVAATRGAVNLAFYENGQLSQVKAETEDLALSGDFGELTSQGLMQADLQFDDQGQLSSLAAHADQASFVDDQTTLAVTGGDLQASFTDGNLAHLTAQATAVSHTDGSNRLSLEDGKLDVAFEDGLLSSATASIGEGTFAGEFGSIDIAEGAGFAINYQDGVLADVHGQIAGLTYAGDDGRLILDQGSIDGTFRADGTIERLELNAEGIDFTGTAEHGQGTHVSFASTNAVLTSGEDGGQVLTLSGQEGDLEIDGKKIGIESCEQLQLTTSAEGAITGIDASFPGEITFEESDGDLAVRVVDLTGSLRTGEAGTTASLAFSETDVVMRSEGITAHLGDGSIDLSERELRVHIGDAHLLQEIEGQLGFEADVVGFDMKLKSGESGQLTDIEVAVENLEAHTDEFNIFVRNAEGQQFRLHTSFSEDGTALRSVFMQIPEGGEIEVGTDDNRATFGAMTARLTRSDDGALRLQTEGLDVDAVWDGMEVRMDSETIDVGLDPERGLVFNQISGTHINVKLDGQQVDIDIDALDNLMLRTTGIEGLAQGASLELVPTGPDSELTARISTHYNGIPISLEFDNLAALKIAGQVKTNEVHVLMADPSGRGTITAEAGPLKLEGSAIEIYARYREYDPQRMLSSVGRFMSSDGIQLTKALSVESDGVVRLGTSGSGVFAETAVILPRPSGAAPGYLFSSGQPDAGVDQGGAGMVVSLGGAGVTRSGNRYVGSLFVGALPGSYFELDQVQGQASLYGVPLPSRMTLPTTAVGGLNFRSQSKDVRWDATLGAFVNPAALAPDEARPYIHEDNLGGGFAGVNIRQKNWSAGADVLVDVDRNRNVGLGGVRLRIGFSL